MKDILDRCRKLMLRSSSDYGTVLRCVQENNKERLNKTALQFVRTCEKLAFSAREIASVYSVYTEKSNEILLDSVPENSDILFPCELSDNGIFHIKLPMFSHRTKPEKTLLHPILSKTLALYFSQYDNKHGLHRRYEKGTLAYIFSFASGTPGFDIDNLNDMEFKKTSDEIVSYFLPDDNGFCCSRFQMAQKSNQTCVDAYFIPNGMFLDWMRQIEISIHPTTDNFETHTG